MNLVTIEAIPLLRRAICQAIETNPENKICYHAPDLHNLEAIIAEFQPDLLWLDATMPEVHDGSAFLAIHKHYPDLKILLFGVGESVPEIRKYFKLGVSAYLSKTADGAEIEAALTAVGTGVLYVPACMNKVFASWLTDPVSKKKISCKLTQREQETLKMIAEGKTNKAIAVDMRISIKTVEKHRQNLMDKLGFHETATLTRYALYAGFVY